MDFGKGIDCRELSMITGDPKYANAIKRIYKIIEKNSRNSGLLPQVISYRIVSRILYSLLATDRCICGQTL